MKAIKFMLFINNLLIKLLIEPEAFANVLVIPLILCLNVNRTRLLSCIWCPFVDLFCNYYFVTIDTILTYCSCFQGLFIEAKTNDMRLGICSRSNDVVEPLIKPQWYVSCSSMAKAALNAAMDDENRKLDIIPKQYAAEWKRWAHPSVCLTFRNF